MYKKKYSSHLCSQHLVLLAALYSLQSTVLIVLLLCSWNLKSVFILASRLNLWNIQ